MHKYKNVAITGAKGAGKSTLARWLLQQRADTYAGFQTVCYAMTSVGPLYALEELTSGKAAPISRLTADGIRGIPENFEGFGKDVVLRAVESPAEILLLDEIGRFERNSPGFLQAVTMALESNKPVIAILKQEPIPHIQEIRNREDTLFLDLNLLGRDRARAALKEWIAIN